MASVRAEGGLVDVVGVHAHLVVAAAEVELDEEPRAAKFVEELVHHGYSLSFTVLAFSSR